MLLFTTFLVSQSEYLLILTTREVRFGEVYGVEIPDEPLLIPMELTERESCLLEAIRSGFQEISVLQVHNGEPVYAEIDGRINGFCCRSKIKFPTERSEG